MKEKKINQGYRSKDASFQNKNTSIDVLRQLANREINYRNQFQIL